MIYNFMNEFHELNLSLEIKKFAKVHAYENQVPVKLY